MARNLAFVSCFVLLFQFVCLAIADTCSDASKLTNIEIKRTLSIEYTTEQNNYWSTACSAQQPSCILFPSTAADVAAIVRILNQNNDTFVVKSGGHNANKGFASINGGPLISTKNLNQVIFDSASMTVDVGPGNKWEDVQKVLQSTGVTVVGGRIGDVGVGGYMLGGGLSFLSVEYGWAANNVVEYEIVLANATIATVSNTSYPDLFKALKGGGNSYGIVTSYKMIAHPQGQVSLSNTNWYASLTL
jgi:FAD/FMN-containing dehydrogenase